jgi:nucleoside-diphosphate-sugar epimerase
MKKYLITGGTGFIGSALVHRLVQAGHQVRVLDNQSRGSLNRLTDVEDDIELIVADIRDAQAVQAAVKGMDSVCHLAFVNGTEFFYSKPELVLDVGVKGMVNVVDACLQHQVGELILASSSEVYQTPPIVPTDESVPLSIPNPLNPRYSYAAGKIISEIMALNYGRQHLERVLIFRPHNVYGPDMGWEHVIPQFIIRMKNLIQQTDGVVAFPIQGTGQETRAFVFIEDFTDALMLVLKQGTHLEIYHLGTQDEITIATLAKRVGDYFNRQIEIIPQPLASGGTLRRCPDISKIKAFGFQPKYSISAGLNITAKWYDKNSQQSPIKN